MQDDYAIQSFERGLAARDSGAFAWEIAPVRLLVILDGKTITLFANTIIDHCLDFYRLKFLAQEEDHQRLLTKMMI